MIALPVQKPGFANRTRCVQDPNGQSSLETAKEEQYIAALTPKSIDITQHGSNYVYISVVCFPKAKLNKGQVKQINLLKSRLAYFIMHVYIYKHINVEHDNLKKDDRKNFHFGFPIILPRCAYF